MNNICLVIVFNHRYDKNIKKLKHMYENRFKHIYFLVPFYDGVEDNVIPVYESSHQFQGYFAQGISRFYKEEFSHYVFIGDDLILNPLINENNICEYFGLGKNDSFIESLSKLNESGFWPYFRIRDAVNAFSQKATSFQQEIPTLEEAEEIADSYGFKNFSLSNYHSTEENFIQRIKSNIRKKVEKPNLSYPLFTGYSDIVIVSKNSIKEFCRLSGVFAAMRLFVEIAIPTAMVLTCKKLKMSKDAQLLTPKMWLVTEPVLKIEDSCNYEIENLYKNWPKEYAYLHPIKLSKWRE